MTRLRKFLILRFIVALLAIMWAWPLQAGFLLNSYMVVPGVVKSITYISSCENASSTPWSCTSVNFGADDTTRTILVGCETGSAAVVTSIVVGGVTATVKSIENSDYFAYYAAVPTGASGTITITWTLAKAGSCSFFRVTGLTQDDYVECHVSTTINCNLADVDAITAGGSAFYCHSAGSGTTTISTWNGTDAFTESVDKASPAANDNYSAGVIFPFTQTSTTLDMDVARSTSSNGDCFGWSWQ